MDLLRTIGFLFLYYITLSKLGAEFDTLDGFLVGAAANLLFTGNEKEE
ncbi:hypothetical protein [Streptococcus danieliae]|nr:hypothetical protein [Streptococcus danieliae]MCU0083129.1 hypothetical protein [Streptococcus danieliae]